VVAARTRHEHKPPISTAPSNRFTFLARIFRTLVRIKSLHSMLHMCFRRLACRASFHAI
jgi:hypothetical protein